MKRDDLTIRELLRVWWAYYWRTWCATLGFSIVFGVVCGVAGAFSGIGIEPVKLAVNLLSAAVTLPVSIWFLRTVVSKTYGAYQLLALKNGAPLDETAPFFKKLVEILPLWWAYGWRAFAFSLGLFPLGIVAFLALCVIWIIVARMAGFAPSSAAAAKSFLLVLILCWGMGIIAVICGSLLALRVALSKSYDSGLEIQLLRRRPVAQADDPEK